MYCVLEIKLNTVVSEDANCTYLYTRIQRRRWLQRTDQHSSQAGRPTDNSQQYSTYELKLGNEPHEGFDTKNDWLTDWLTGWPNEWMNVRQLKLILTGRVFSVGPERGRIYDSALPPSCLKSSGEIPSFVSLKNLVEFWLTLTRVIWQHRTNRTKIVLTAAIYWTYFSGENQFGV
jgi:hypothetical protein